MGNGNNEQPSESKGELADVNNDLDEKSTEKNKSEYLIPPDYEFQSSWAGPLPHPRDLSAYDKVVPGSAREIFDAWHRERDHRHDQDRRDLGWSIFESIFGKLVAFVFLVIMISISAYCALNGAELFAVALAGGTVASTIWAFVAQNRSERENSVEN